MKMTYYTAPGATRDEKLENWLEATGKVLSYEEITNEGGEFSRKEFEASNGVLFVVWKLNGKTVSVFAK